MSRTLHFTIGPVQSFVSQSRRTRDLLTSSFLLSYLSGVAMIHVLEAGGKIIFPAVVNAEGELNDFLLKAIRIHSPFFYRWSSVETSEGPWVGSLPNRFQAEIPDQYSPQETVIAVKKAWYHITNVVWKQMIQPIHHLGNQTKAIWRRQVRGCWDIQWVIGDEWDSLRRRKYWRSHIPTIEAGDKCHLMSHLQELSGYVRSMGATSRQKQVRFWSALRQKLHNPPTSSLDLGEHERLSAIGVMKRFLCCYAKEALGWSFPAEAIHFPSTRLLASIPWRKQFFKWVNPKKEDAAKYQRWIDDYVKTAREYSLLAQPWKKRLLYSKHPFFRLSEEALDPEYLKSYPLLQKKFEHLCQRVGSEPDQYYAVLKMDGDRLGYQLRHTQNFAGISEALAQFTHQVIDLIEKYSGALIYAGGDDLLALFPVDQALSAALELQKTYQNSFGKKQLSDQVFTISAGLVFAHQKTPLQQILHYATRMLDEVAKHQHGRNSIGIGIYGPSGPLYEWAAPWEIVRDPEDPQKTKLETLAKHLPIFPSFLFQLKQVLEPISETLSPEDLAEWVIAEWERIFESSSPAMRDQLTTLVHLGYPSIWKDGKVHVAAQPFSADIALMVRWFRKRLGYQ